MSRILGRGAELDPEVEVVTAQASGTHRQTLKQTWNRAQQVANALKSHGIETVTGSAASCGTTTATWSFIRACPVWAASSTP